MHSLVSLQKIRHPQAQLNTLLMHLQLKIQIQNFIHHMLPKLGSEMLRTDHRDCAVKERVKNIQLEYK